MSDSLLIEARTPNISRAAIPIRKCRKRHPKAAIRRKQRPARLPNLATEPRKGSLPWPFMSLPYWW